MCLQERNHQTSPPPSHAEMLLPGGVTTCQNSHQCQHFYYWHICQHCQNCYSCHHCHHCYHCHSCHSCHYCHYCHHYRNVTGWWREDWPDLPATFPISDYVKSTNMVQVKPVFQEIKKKKKTFGENLILTTKTSLAEPMTYGRSSMVTVFHIAAKKSLRAQFLTC